MGETRRDMPGRNNLEENILRSLRKITRAVDLYSRQLSRQYQLTGPQVVCMRQLLADAPMTAGKLAHSVSLSQATITGILDRLEVQGVVVRQRCTQDRRRVLVSLSERGQELATKVPSPLQERFAERLRKLPEENRVVIDTVLQQVVGMMEAKNIEAEPILQSDPPPVID